MKKLLVGAVAATAGVLLVGPFATGFYVESLHDEFIENMQEQNPAFKIEKTDYQRGWFNSNAKYTYRFGSIPSEEEGGEPTPIEIQLLTRSHHGPLPFTALQDDNAEFTFGLATLEYRGTMDEFLKFLDVTTEGMPDFISSGHISYGGSYHYRCDIGEGQGSVSAAPEGLDRKTVQLSWKQTECHGSSDLRSGDGEFSLQSPEFVISGVEDDSDKRVVLTNASLEGEIIDGDSDLPLTNVDMKIGRMAFNDPERDVDLVAVADVHVFGKADKDGEKLDFDLAYRIGEMQSPLVSGKDFFLEFELEDVDRDAAVKLRKEYQRFNVAMMDANAAMANAQDPEEILAIYEEAFGKGALLKLLPEVAKLFNEAEFSLGFGQLNTESAPQSIGIINGFSAKLFTTNMSEGVPLGGYEVTLADWEMDIDEELQGGNPFKSVAIKNLKITDRAEASGDDLQLRSVYSADTFAMNDMTFTDVKFGSTLGGLDKPMADKLFSELVAAVMDEETGHNPQAFMQGRDPQVLMKELQILFQNTRLSLDDFGFSTKDGRADLKGEVTLKNLNFSKMRGPEDLLGVISAALDLKLDEGLVLNVIDMAVALQVEDMPEDMPAEQVQGMRDMMRSQFSGMVGSLIEQGLIEKTDTGFKSKARFEEATLTVNGEEMPLPF